MKTSINSLLRVAVKSAFAVTLAVGATSAQAQQIPDGQELQFYTDFYKQPQGWFDHHGSISKNNKFFTITAGDATIHECGGMTFGGYNGAAATIYAFKDGAYAAATEEGVDNSGASGRSIQFNGGKGYVLTPVVSAPCTVTLWIGNANGTTAKTTEVWVIPVVDGVDGEAASFVTGTEKSAYKRSYEYKGTGNVQFRIVGYVPKSNIFDILITKPIDQDAPKVEFVPTSDLNLSDVSYEDGSLSIAFSDRVAFSGTPVIGGADRYEEFAFKADYKSLNISYAALQPNHEYTITFPAGCVTNDDASQSFEGTLTFRTADFSAEVADGATHYGKAFAALPVSFKPFDTFGSAESFNPEFTQSKASDYPHWVQVSGDVTAEHAVITKTADKVMGYFAPQSKLLYLDLAYEGEGDVEVKVQEARNPDVAPRWATVRVLRKGDMPFKGNIALNSESRFVKVSAPVISSGELSVNNLAISDSNGDFGTTTAIEDVIGATVVSTEVYTVAGVRLAAPAEGLNIVRTVYANGAVKVSKVVR